MKLSIAICTHNETEYIKPLFNNLISWLNSPTTLFDGHEYEVVIVDDHSTDPILLSFFDTLPEQFKVIKHSLNGHYADHKNFMNSQCAGDWILNLDADESIPEAVLDILPMIVEANPGIEAYWIPRINTVEGLTLKHVQKWGWVITKMEGFRQAREVSPEEYELLKAYDLIISEENGFVTFHQPIINFPDMQMRFYKNADHIYWQNKVHESLNGHINFSHFPLDPDYAIRHPKEISRQTTQNEYYDRLLAQ